MQSLVYDVTLYWHDGGCVFLGTVPASSFEVAGNKALDLYIAKNKANKKEIEYGGGFQVSAELLRPEEAAKWWAPVLSK